jgi:hypothetical protein
MCPLTYAPMFSDSGTDTCFSPLYHRSDYVH